MAQHAADVWVPSVDRHLQTCRCLASTRSVSRSLNSRSSHHPTRSQHGWSDDHPWSVARQRGWNGMGSLPVPYAADRRAARKIVRVREDSRLAPRQPPQTAPGRAGITGTRLEPRRVSTSGRPVSGSLRRTLSQHPSSSTSRVVVNSSPRQTHERRVLHEGASLAFSGAFSRGGPGRRIDHCLGV